MPVKHLDYPKAQLAMQCDTPVEEAYRINACQKETWTTAFIEDMPTGSIFWDIGANVGPYSLVAASRGCIPVAVEPAFFNHGTLCKNLAMNGFLDKSLPLWLGLGERNGWEWMHFTDSRSGAASHRLGGTRKTTFQKMLIELRRWDDLAPTLPLPPDRLHFAKIDVDGFERQVLRGGPETLKRLQSVMIELRPDDEAEITALLAEAGLHQAARYDQRDGKPMQDLAYGRYERGE